MTKRKKNSSKNQHQGSKRPRNDTEDSNELGKFEASRGYIDASTGQRGAFPGLENYADDFFGPPMDGIDYLRMVRCVAVPSYLHAPPPSNTAQIRSQRRPRPPTLGRSQRKSPTPATSPPATSPTPHSSRIH